MILGLCTPAWREPASSVKMLNRSFANGARGRRPRWQGTYAWPVDPVAGAAPGSGQGAMLLSATCRSAEPGACRTKNNTARDTTMSDSRSKKDSTPKLDRRKFLAAAAVAGAGSAVKPADAAPSTAVQAPPRVPSALPPNEHVAAAETDVPNIAPYKTEGRPGSDFMVDVIKSLDIKYLPSNPASSYRAIHESLIDYGKNTMPEFLTCTHEEVGVGIAHGYYKIAQKPLLTLCHGTVGLMHATMNVYDAFCDRAAVVILA